LQEKRGRKGEKILEKILLLKKSSKKDLGRKQRKKRREDPRSNSFF
jgi:hypothetical protein